MFREQIENLLREIEEADGQVKRVFCRWKPYESCHSNERMYRSEFDGFLDKVFNSSAMNGDWSSIQMICFYTNSCIHVLLVNPLYDFVNDECRENAIVYENVPFLTDDLTVAVMSWLKYEIPSAR